MVVASGQRDDLSRVLTPELVRTDDPNHDGKRLTEGQLSLAKPSYKLPHGHTTYETLCSWLRVSIENEEFLRGAVWLVALMPDRARAVDALERVAQTAGTNLWFSNEGLRSAIVANAAIATLIAMGGSDVDLAVLRLSKLIENRTVNKPLFKHLNG